MLAGVVLDGRGAQRSGSRRGQSQGYQCPADTPLDLGHEIHGIHGAVGDAVAHGQVGPGRRRAEVDVHVRGERETAVGQQGREPVAQPLAGTDLAPSGPSPARSRRPCRRGPRRPGTPGRPVPRSGPEDHFGDAEVIGRPKPGEQVGLGQVTPDLNSCRRQRPQRPERSVVGPSGPVRRELLGARTQAVPVELGTQTVELVDTVGQSAQRGREFAERIGPQGVDAPLTRPHGGDHADPLERLQVLGRLQLAGTG